MGLINFSIPKDLVLQFLEKRPIDNFIETGTFRGGTSFWAANHFQKVYTIEIDAELSKSTASNPLCPKNIEFLVGNSKEVLPQLMASGITGSCLFWLDGHWCSGGGGKDEECPLLDELEAIKSAQDSIILIDDARCFLGPLPKPHDSTHWPRIDQVFKKITETFPNHHFTIQDDVILVLPAAYLPVFDEEWVNNFHTRFSFGRKLSTWEKVKNKLFRN